MNNAFMMHASTSPFYPLFAALDVNAKMHEGVSGRNMWMDCVVNGIDARKLILENCHHIRPFVPELIDGKPWQSYPTSEIASDLRFFHFVPENTGMRLKAMPNISTLSTLANCCSPHRALMQRAANMKTLAFLPRSSPTSCARTALCRKNATSTPFCSC